MTYYVTYMPMFGVAEGYLLRDEVPRLDAAIAVAQGLAASGQFHFVEVEDGDGQTVISEGELRERRKPQATKLAAANSLLGADRKQRQPASGLTQHPNQLLVSRVVIRCSRCKQLLRVPAGRRLRIGCPQCGLSEMRSTPSEGAA